VGVQWHWGNIGSAAGGLAGATAALAAVYAIIRRGPDGYRAWRERQTAERDLAREQATAFRLERHRRLYGWSPGGVEVYGVVRITDPAEMAKAADELTGRGPSDYVVLKVAEGTANANRALSLRQLIDREGFLARAPTQGEREALEAGLKIITSSEQPLPDSRRRAATDG
jgi:hypothetical protein